MKTKWLVGLVAAAFVAPLGALAAGQARTVEISVTTNGFEPARVKVTKGEPLKLVVTRKTDDTCAKEIVIPDENIKADLPLNKPVTLTFTPKRAGELQYACGMGMYTGVLVVASSDGAGRDGEQSMDGAPNGSDGMQGMGRMHDHGGTMQGQRCNCMSRARASNGS